MIKPEKGISGALQFFLSPLATLYVILYHVLRPFRSDSTYSTSLCFGMSRVSPPCTRSELWALCTLPEGTVTLANRARHQQRTHHKDFATTPLFPPHYHENRNRQNS